MNNIFTRGSKACLAAALLINSFASGAVPVISSFNPASGTNGTPVTISGANFGTFPSNNIVYFGAVRATVTSANQSNLLVTVPVGATYAPVTVLVNGLVAYTSKPFQPTFAGSGAAFSSASLGPQLTFGMPSGPQQVAIGDLDGDGKPDLIINNAYANNISLFRNISSGGTLTTNSFATRVDLPPLDPSGTLDSPYDVIVGDVDGDGKLDIVTVDGFNNKIVVYRNISGPGNLTTNSFAPAVSFDATGNPRGVRIADIDGDGRADIVFSAQTSGVVSVLRNIGTAGSINSNSFAAAVSFPAGSSPEFTAVGDLDGDGKPDLAVVNTGDSTVSVYRNVSTPGVINSNSFAARVDFPAPSTPVALEIADIDGDGKADLLVGGYFGPMSIYRNTSTVGSLTTNSFAPSVDFATAGRSHTIALGDLNGDGKTDIALVTELDSALSLFENVSTPGAFSNSSLAPRVDYATGYNAWGVAVGDLNGDGRPDIVFGNSYDTTISVYQNLAGATVLNGPVITSQPTNQTVSVGGTASFSVTATGSPTLQYQWVGPGTNSVVGGTNSTLTLSNVQPNAAGVYYVVVFNSAGYAISSNALLTVNGGTTSNTAPVITKQPTNQTVSAGGTATFSVTATGSPTLHYQWYGPGSSFIPGAVNPTLTLSNVQPGNAGAYFVFVTNLFGFAQSSNAVLTVTGGGGTSNTCTPPPSGISAWWPGEGNGNDIVGGNTAVAQPGVSYFAGEVGQAFWLNNSNAYLMAVGSSNLNVGAGGSLTVEAWVALADVTGYHPIVEWNNNGGGVGVHLWVQPFNGQPGALFANVVGTDGTSHPFTSAAGSITTNGFQHVALTYDQASGMGMLYVNGSSVAQANLGSFTPQTSYAIWLGHRPGDVVGDITFGSYLGGLLDELSLYRRALSASEIAAIYNAGTSGKCTSITSNSAPIITKQPTNQTVSAGGTATFSVTATGSPTLHYQWFGPGSTLIAGGINPTLTLSNVQPSSAGVYHVTITNLFGSAFSSNAVLTVTGGSSGGGNTNLVVPNYTATNQIHVSDGTLNEVGRVQTVYAASQFPTTPITITEIRWRPDEDAGGPLSVTISNLQIHFSMTPANPDGLSPVFGQNTGTNDTIVFNGTANFSSAFNTLSNGTKAFDISLPLQTPFVYDPSKGNLLVDLHNFSGCTPPKGNFANGTTGPDATSRVFAYNPNATNADVVDTGGDVLQIIYTVNGGTSNTAPVITKQPTNQTVAVGGTAIFSVTATGSPTLHYQWYGPGSSFIPGAVNPTLTLSNVQPGNAGSYFVFVTNLFGFAQSSNAILTVTGGGGGSSNGLVVPNYCTNTQIHASGGEFNSVTREQMVYNASEFPAGPITITEIRWRPDQDAGGPISTTISNLQVHLSTTKTNADNLSLAFAQNIGADDTVVFSGPLHINTAFITLSNGTTAFDISMPLQTPFTYDPSKGNLLMDFRNFTGCTPNHGNFLNVAGGTDATSRAYAFDPNATNATIADTGGPVLQIVYTTATTSNTAPVITKQPTNQTVSAGGTATFSVTATGSPTLHYQWYGPGSSFIPGAVNPTLTLSNVQPGNAGAYFVFVTNLFGFAQSSNAVLTVTGGGGTSNTCTPPPSGISAWWPGEGNGNDIVGGNTAVAQPGVSYFAGEVGQAFWLNNSNAYLMAVGSSNLNVGAGGSLTVEAWVALADVTGYHPIVEWNNNGGGVGVHLWVQPFNGQPGALFANVVGTDGTSHPFTSAAGSITTNGFQHVALTYDQASGMGMLYVNGSSVAQANLGSFTPQTSYAIWLGHRPGDVVGDITFGSYLGGLLDELSLYRRALSASEIAAIYNAGTSGKCTGTTSNTPPVITKQPTNQTVSAGGTATFSVTVIGSPTLHYQWFGPGSTLIAGGINPTLTLSNVQPSSAGVYHVTITNLFGSAFSSNAVLTVTGGGGTSNTCTPPPTGLVAWWKAEGNGLDSAGTNNGTLLGNLGFTNGEVGQAFNFTDTTQGVHVNASPSLAVKNLTIEAWIRPIDVSDFHPIIEYGQDTGPDPVQFLYGWNDPGGSTPGALFGIFRGTNDSVLLINSPAGILPAGQWSHVAMTFNFTNQTGTLYLNGNAVGSSVFTNGIMTPQTSLPIHIGYRPNTSGEGRAGDRLSGGLDEVSIYNRTLSASEIQAIYHAGSSGKCTSDTALAIITQPTNTTATVGSTAKLSVTAVGTGPLSYQWFRTNAIVPGATSSTLTFSNVQFSAAGIYHVVVSDSHSSVNSSNATLSVIAPPVATVAVVTTTTTGGATFDLPINLIANGNENALSFTLNFDPALLTFSAINPGNNATNGLILSNTSQASNGVIGVQLALPAGVTFNAGTQQIVRVTFSSSVAISTTQLVTTVSFTGVPIAKLLSDAGGNALPANFIAGSVLLSPTQWEGDATPVPAGNGTVDLFDWVQVGRFVAGLDTITNGSEFQKVDCAPRNTLGDGKLTVADWVQAGRYAAGLDPLTPAGGPTSIAAHSLIANAENISSPRQITVQSGSTVKGMTVTLPITMVAQGDETALAFSLNFDPKALQFVSAVKGSDTSAANLVVNANQAAGGQVAMVLCLPSMGSHFPAGTLQLAKVTFVALTSTTNNAVSFADQPVARSISDASATELTANYQGNSVIVNPQPTVGLSHTGNSSVLSWPTWAGDFTLQAAGSLTPPINWTNVPMTLQTNGNNIQVTLPTPDQQIFFRLYHP